MREKCDQEMIKQANEDDYLKDYFTIKQVSDVKSLDIEVTNHILETCTFMIICIFFNNNC